MSNSMFNMQTVKMWGIVVLLSAVAFGLFATAALLLAVVLMVCLGVLSGALPLVPALGFGECYALVIALSVLGYSLRGVQAKLP